MTNQKNPHAPSNRSLSTIVGRNNLVTKILDETEQDDLLDVDLTEYEDSLTADQAKELVQELAYWLMYLARAEKDGLPYSSKEAYDIITGRYAWLVRLSGYKYRTHSLTLKHAEAIRQKRWDEAYVERSIFAHQRFRNAMIKVDKALPRIEKAIEKGDLGAVDKLVALLRFEMDAAGYKAPTRYEFSAAGNKELTEDQKASLSAAIEEMKEFDQELLEEDSRVIDGEFEEEE